jgi:hypothetical protein
MVKRPFACGPLFSRQTIRQLNYPLAPLSWAINYCGLKRAKVFWFFFSKKNRYSLLE